jgi:tetratricopeptide (TPR) repeat protein
MIFNKIFSVKKVSYVLTVLGVFLAILMINSILKVNQINKFNKIIKSGDTPEIYSQTYEARFSSAFRLAEKEYFKEATNLFNNLTNEGSDNQKSAVHYNIGNIFFKRGLLINGTSNDNNVRAEAEYLFRQAKKAYEQSLKHDNSHWDAKHNLDRLLTLLPSEPTPGIGDSDSPGLIMGNIPVGLP